MNTFDMMDYGHVLAWDREAGLAVTWNGNATYNLWATADDGAVWDNVDVRTYDPTSGSTPVTMRAATVYAGDYLQDVMRPDHGLEG
jgi:hypothetical protein